MGLFWLARDVRRSIILLLMIRETVSQQFRVTIANSIINLGSVLSVLKIIDLIIRTVLKEKLLITVSCLILILITV